MGKSLRILKGARRDRKGILLLVVLSLLVLFLLVGTSFIITSSHYRRAQKTLAAAAVPETAKNPLQQDDLIEEVLNQLVRDTDNPFSSLRYHSLLRDLYGEDGLVFELPNTTAGTGDTDIVFAPNTGDQFITVGMTFTATPPLRQINGYYNGLLWTMTEGPWPGQSMRIVNYRYLPAAAFPYQFDLLRPERFSGTLTNFADEGDRVVINGRPFNGTGVGYNPIATTGALLSTAEMFPAGGVPTAVLSLMPNASTFDPNATVLTFDGVTPDPNDAYFLTPAERAQLSQGEQDRVKGLRGISGLGGSDESYDAVDFQNMFLAMMPVSPIECRTDMLADPMQYPWPNPLPQELGNIVLPSFHRPDLIHYWAWQFTTTDLRSSTLGDEPGLLRKIMLRPNWLDHPDFTGSNPEFAAIDPADTNARLMRMIYGPWDVDNDNDGRRDSEWVDFGAPVMEGPQGRLVKPLVAILCVDLDGRLNLNAHGSPEQLVSPIFDPDEDLDGDGFPDYDLAGNVSTDTLPQGQGYGPAEISLEPVVSVPSNPDNAAFTNLSRFDELLYGATIDNTGDGPTPDDRFWPGRYGSPTLEPRPKPGVAGAFDLLAQLKMQGFPQWANQLGNYATPPDLKGRYALGLNPLGQPVYEVVADIGDPNNQLDIDSPYELDLSRVGPHSAGDSAKDGPFSLAELERILRAYDPDASKLPPRLWELANRFRTPESTEYSANLVDTDELNEWRTLLTTDSFDLPVPNVTLPDWMRVGPNGVADSDPISSDDFADVMGREPVNLTFSDLLEYRVRVGLKLPNPPTALNAAQQALLQRVMNQLLAPELADGLRLDINRPLGNGKDDDGDGVVDEPGEDEGPYWTFATGAGRADTRSNPDATDDFDGTDPNKPFAGYFRDAIDRNGDGTIDRWERGDFLPDNGNGIADPNDGDGTLSQIELVNLHNFRRQLLARHLYVLAMTLVDPLPSTATVKVRQKRARQLAQWAINVVDYRDPDNIMTGFEYDANPFDGWGVDGTIANDGFDGIAGTPDDVVSADDDTTLNPQRGVVWGMERPELVMTETLAWHDRRTTDEGPTDEFPNAGHSAKSVLAEEYPDQDFDQLYRPRGAAFVELYNPYPADTAPEADTRAVADVNALNPDFDGDGNPDFGSGDDMGVNLAAMASVPNPGNPGQTYKSPVWRLAVYKTGNNQPAAETVSWDPDDPNSEIQSHAMDRSVYFTRDGLISATELQNVDKSDGVEFFTSLNIPPVRPGRFLVVGSGMATAGGIYTSSLGRSTAGAEDRAVVLDATNGGVLIDNPGNDPNEGVDVATVTENQLSLALQVPSYGNRPICDVAIINRAVDMGVGVDRRFTLTEPAEGYTNDGWSPVGDPDTNEGWYGLPGQKNALDTPLDDQRTDGETRLKLPEPTTSSGPTTVETPRIVECFSWIYLQRLANPTLPHDAKSNPYLTVDGMSANVDVFNSQVPSVTGEQRWESDYQEGGSVGSPDDVGLQKYKYLNDQAVFYLSSLQRGYNARTQSSEPELWNYELPNSRAPGAVNRPEAGETELKMAQVPQNRMGRGAGTQTLDAILDCTLGFLNDYYLNPSQANNPNDRRFKMNPPAPAEAAKRQLIPERPFPWIDWNNRPYTSAGELLQVPVMQSSRLTRAFAASDVASGTEVYSGTAKDWPVEGSHAVSGGFEVDGKYAHLANFFRADDGNGTDGIAGMYRVLDYVGVPSRYVGTETWLSPASFGSGDPTTTDDPRYLRQPPFNEISNYREPGRVNINTMGHPAVWDGGVLHRRLSDPTQPFDVTANNYVKDSGHTGPNFLNVAEASIVSSRQGYDAAANSMFQLRADRPTFFANPFRTADEGSLVPLDIMLRSGLDSSIMRSSDSTSGAAATPSGSPVLSANNMGPGNEFRDAARNPYFRYQPLTRLSSMTTTHSNVYAVWVTIGFFEVEEAPPLEGPGGFSDRNGFGTTATPESRALYARVYPEGYQLGQEMGSDTGDFHRLRGFAIVDRSIPVAFEPGEDHNVERAVRLRRRIE